MHNALSLIFYCFLLYFISKCKTVVACFLAGTIKFVLTSFSSREVLWVSERALGAGDKCEMWLTDC